MLSNTFVVPIWHCSNTTRQGKHLRQHRDRFFYLPDHGWFVYVRDERTELPGLVAHAGILGPFSDKAEAINSLIHYLIRCCDSLPAGQG